MTPEILKELRKEIVLSLLDNQHHRAARLMESYQECYERLMAARKRQEQRDSYDVEKELKRNDRERNEKLLQKAADQDKGQHYDRARVTRMGLFTRDK